MQSPRSGSVAGSALIAGGLLLVLLSGAVYGHYSRRWGVPADLDVAARQLESFPAQIGDWQLTSEHELGSGTVQMLECAGYVNRTYANSVTGDVVTLAVLVGPPGPIAVHTPEICYSSRDYSLQGSRVATRFANEGSNAHHFWRTEFEKRDMFADRMSVYYAWNDGDQWIASRSPRFEFAGSPCLFKFQLAGTIPKKSNASQDDPPAQFINEFLKSGWTPKATQQP